MNDRHSRDFVLDAQESFYQAFGPRRVDAPRDDPHRDVRGGCRCGGVVQHRLATPARRRRPSSREGRDSGGQFALFPGASIGDRQTREGCGGDGYHEWVDHCSRRMLGYSASGTSRQFRGTNRSVPGFDVVRSSGTRLRRREFDGDSQPRGGGRNALRIETWPHASLMEMRDSSDVGHRVAL